MERDLSAKRERGEIKQISTHTLTWSVISSDKIKKWSWEISTHTLTWSVTYRKYRDYVPLFDFNSHAHVERDPEAIGAIAAQLTISTHTLTWSVTGYLCNQGSLNTISTHTLTWSVTL